MYDGNPEEINFGSSQRGFKLSRVNRRFGFLKNLNQNSQSNTKTKDRLRERGIKMIFLSWNNNNNNNKNNNIYRGSPTRQGGFQWGPHALI